MIDRFGAKSGRRGAAPEKGHADAHGHSAGGHGTGHEAGHGAGGHGKDAAHATAAHGAESHAKSPVETAHRAAIEAAAARESRTTPEHMKMFDRWYKRAGYWFTNSIFGSAIGGGAGALAGKGAAALGYGALFAGGGPATWILGAAVAIPSILSARRMLGLRVVDRAAKGAKVVGKMEKKMARGQRRAARDGGDFVMSAEKLDTHIRRMSKRPSFGAIAWGLVGGLFTGAVSAEIHSTGGRSHLLEKIDDTTYSWWEKVSSKNWWYDSTRWLWEGVCGTTPEGARVEILGTPAQPDASTAYSSRIAENLTAQQAEIARLKAEAAVQAKVARGDLVGALHAGAQETGVLQQELARAKEFAYASVDPVVSYDPEISIGLAPGMVVNNPKEAVTALINSLVIQGANIRATPETMENIWKHIFTVAMNGNKFGELFPPDMPGVIDLEPWFLNRSGGATTLELAYKLAQEKGDYDSAIVLEKLLSAYQPNMPGLTVNLAADQISKD